MLSALDYQALTGEEAPEDFAACLALAQEVLNAHTLGFYAGRDAATLPALIGQTLKHFLAFQTLAVIAAGGVAGAAEPPLAHASLGRFSYTAGAGAQAPCPAAATVLPLLVSYARGR